MYTPMDKTEYTALKKHDMEVALERVIAIEEADKKYVHYPDSRPIMDLKHMMESSAEKYKDHPAFMQKFVKGEPFKAITYKEAMDDINGLGTSLIKLGLQGKRIAVCGENCYFWALSYLAVTCGTGVVVPLDKELSEKEIEQQVVDAEIEAVLCSKKLEPKFIAVREKHPELKVIINFTKENSDEISYSQTALVNEGKALIEEGDRSYLDAQVLRDELGVLLFTSGTTGISKGVMLSQGNIVEDLMASPTVLEVTDHDIFFSVLPLHHTYACTCDFLMPLYKGACIAYCQGLKYIQKDMAEVKPTFFLSVPLILEMLYKKIWKNIRAQGKEDKINKALKICRTASKLGIHLEKKFFKDIHNVFGGRMHVLIVGGAAINPDILKFFREVGILALQGYGLTECAPMGALSPDWAPKDASVGRKFPGTDIKIDNPGPDGIGEILLKGGNVMLGYYKNPEATAEVIKDGWYYTGDLGYLDSEDYLFITGRKKNVIITKNGKNVFPEELEYYLSNVPYVAESMVWGDSAKDGEDITIVASIYPDSEEVALKLGKDYEKADVEKLLWEEVDKINAENPFFKKIKRIIVRDKELDKNYSNKVKRYSEENRRG
ncbi:MAG: AMP-binding protein [Clostridia bacterium]|nr:AMP-binding protein [Clostridia bacterium]